MTLRPLGSLERWFRPPEPLDAGAAFLAFDSALLRRGRRLGQPSHEGRTRGAADKVDEPRQRIVPIARLRAMPLRSDDNDTLAGQP